MLTHKCIAHVKQSTVFMALGMHGGAHPAASITLHKIMDPIKGVWLSLCRGRGFQEVNSQRWSMLSCCV